MDFFDRQERARKQTRRLIWFFGLAVLVVLVLNYLILGTLIQAFYKPAPEMKRFPSFFFNLLLLAGDMVVYPREYLRWLWDLKLACWVTLGTLTSIALGCLYKIRLLSAGGSAVAELLGGRCVESNTSDPDEQRLRHVVEEMAIASGTPVPEIYLLDNERGINAFAAGHTRDDMAIGITRGGLKLLTRDELQGVIAHEFSHILNGDTRLNMKLIGLAHGLFWPTILGRVLIYGGTDAPASDESLLAEDERTPKLPTAPIGYLFVIIGSVSLPFVRLLKSAICRQREWLADAAAVQFTRSPDGIGGALKKIGGLFKQGRLDTPNAEVASHLYFAGSALNSWFNFLATHPPLAKRILAIDPAFDGNLPKVKMLAPNQFERDLAFEEAIGRAMAIERALPETAPTLAGIVTAEHLKQVSLMRFGLPPEVKLALRTPSGAAGVVYSLLLSDDDSVRARQMQILQANLAPDSFAQTVALAPQIEALGSRYKLVLAEFAVPALRKNDVAEHDTFHQTMQQLIECDGAIELFEYTLMKMVARQLRSYFNGPEMGKTQYGRVQDVLPECALLLSALAHIGSENETETQAAFAEGAEFLDAPTARIQFLSRREWDLSKVDATLTRLSRCPDAVKRNILLACGRTVAADNQVTEREAELLHAIADSLDCPMPPFVDAIRSEELAREA